MSQLSCHFHSLCGSHTGKLMCVVWPPAQITIRKSRIASVDRVASPEMRSSDFSVIMLEILLKLPPELAFIFIGKEK